jgi:hypothetical protein
MFSTNQKEREAGHFKKAKSQTTWYNTLMSSCAHRETNFKPVESMAAKYSPLKIVFNV